MERFYRFAGTTYRISGRTEDMYELDGILEPFRVESADFDHSMEFEIVSALPEPEGEIVFSSGRRCVFRSGDVQLSCVGEVNQSQHGAYMQIRRKGIHSRIQVLRNSIPDRIMPRLVLNAMEAEHHIVQHGGFLLHASFIRWKDRAILFTAPSGTGKSTQAELWRCYRNAEIINGDRAAVTMGERGATAWGVPFCGTSGLCQNAELPVGAIVYLSQAPKTTIQRLSGLQAFRHVWEGCSVNVWNQEDVETCVQTVMSAVQQVPVYHLACTPDETAVEVLEKMLERGVMQDG